MYLKLVNDLNLTPTTIKTAIFLYKQNHKITHIQKTEIITILQEYYRNTKQREYFIKIYNELYKEIYTVDNLKTKNQDSMSDNDIIFLLKKCINWKTVK